MLSLPDFVAARMADAASASDGAGRDDDPTRSTPPPGTSGWQTLVSDYRSAVHLTEHWVVLELQLRELATHFADHRDFDPRWRTEPVTTSRARSERLGVDGDPGQPTA